MIIYLILVFLSLLALHVMFRYNRGGRLIDKIPGPTPLPFLGNLLMFNIPADKLWNRVIRLLDKYYPIFRLWGCKANCVFLRHPDDLKILLSCKKNIEKCCTVYDNLRYIENEGLIVSGGDKWRQRRKLINPAFNPNLLKVYTEIVHEHAEKFIEEIESQNFEIIPDIVPMFLKLALGIVCEATMGVDPRNLGTEKEKQFRHAFDIIGEVCFYRAARPYIQDWMMKILSVGRSLDRATNLARDFTNKIIKERREYHERVGYQKFDSIVNDVEGDNVTERKKRLAFLDLLLAAQKDNLIDERGLREEVETFVSAGYETSGIAMAMLVLLLAENKKAQDKARDEITQVLKETGGALTIADINKLDYLDRCFKESLRLFPSAPLIGRSVTEEIKLSNYVIPTKTEVFIQFFALHRDANFWPEPEKFDPDRFLPENIQNRHPFAYAPFSAGPRSCIGQKFAALEVKAVVARILSNFYLEPVDLTANINFEMHITLKPKDPCRVKLIRIT